MMPQDILADWVIAVVLLIIFIIGGSVLRLPALEKEEFVYEGAKIQLRDEEEVFFLNLLRKKVEDKTIADLIILSENDKEQIKTLEKEIKKVLEFYGKADYEYGLVIDYSDEEIKDEYLGCMYEIENKGIKQSLPSLNSGLIKLQFTFQGGECIPYWL